jgi:hypothetical protein
MQGFHSTFGDPLPDVIDNKLWRLLLSSLLGLWLVIVLVLLAPGAVGAAAPGTSYTIAARVDLDSGVVDVNQTVAFRNQTGQHLDELVFHVVPAEYGAFTLVSIDVGGRTARGDLDGIVLTIPLPTSLGPGDSTTVQLAYRLRVPRPGTIRFGQASGVLALGNWYPVLAVHRGDWDRHQYTEVGDAFVTEVADYDVTLRLNRPATVAHGGTAIESGPTGYRFTGTALRDFALAISSRYVTRQVVVDGIPVVAHVLPENTAAASELLRTGSEVVRWGSARLGRFPYPSLHIAETFSDNPNWVGQEYPGLIYIGTIALRGGGGIDSYLSYLVAHEVIHQWFYGLVGSDQVREPWVDEAFATYLSYRFYADNYPAVYAGQIARLRAQWAAVSRRLGDRKVNTGVFDYTSESDYFAVVYRRGAIFLDDLHALIGDRAFFDLCREFIAANAGDIARGVDFLRQAQTAGGEPALALIREHFDYPEFARRDANATNWPIQNGHFFAEANGRGGAGGVGYTVTNAGEIRFWDEFRRLGGIEALGYPASHRFVLDGFTVQIFQKAVLQWRPEVQRAYFLNVLDRLSAAGRDDWLAAQRFTPPAADTSADAGLAWPAVVERHRALLDAAPALRSAYLRHPDWLDRYGLPMAYVEYPDLRVVRGQRAVLQQWKVDRPWARAGEVTIANGGDLLKEAGLAPATAVIPSPAPN